MTRETIIDCPHCAVRVKANVTTWIDGDLDGSPAYFLVECPSCNNPLLGSADAYIEGNQQYWVYTKRLWPSPSAVDVSLNIPHAAQIDIKDAQKCFSHGIYSAAAVLCGRALEHLIKEKVGDYMIAKGIAELKAKGIIDQRLFEWAEALRKERNIGAHASEENTTKENAEDIIDFTIAIFDYVYTLSKKYEKYIDRKSTRV